jgi:hypothetical protein
MFGVLLGCLELAACGDDSELQPGSTVWERVLEVEHTDASDCHHSRELALRGETQRLAIA